MLNTFNNKVAESIRIDKTLEDMKIILCEDMKTEVLFLISPPICLHNEDELEDKEDVELFKKLTNGVISNNNNT